MKRWYAVCCKPLQDACAEEHLRNQSFEVFRPRIRLRRRRGGRFRQVVESMFPGYLFIRLDHECENWAPIRSTRGVSGLVRMGANTPAVPEPVIEELKRRTDSDNCIDPGPSDYLPNERVRITEGPLTGYEALFASRSSEERVIVLLEIMQRVQQLVLPERAIEYA